MDAGEIAYLDLQADFLELVGRWMLTRQMSPAELATRLHWTPEYVLAMLDGRSDPTVKQMADVAWALDLRLDLHLLRLPA